MESRKKIDKKDDKRDQSQLRPKSPLLDTLLHAITSFASEDFIAGLKSDNSGIRGHAAGTLSRIVSEGRLEGDVSEAIPLLIILLQDDNIGTRECAAMALRAISKVSDSSNKKVIASALRNSAGPSGI
jgi:hypothetical protein